MAGRSGRPAALATTMLAAAVAASAAAGGTPPIPDSRCCASIAMDIRVSHGLWDGGAWITNKSDRAVVLDGVELVNKSPALRYLGAYVHRYRRSVINLAGARSWPPMTLNSGPEYRPRPYPHRPLAGTRLGAGQDIQVIVRLKSPRLPQRVGYDAVRVLYHQGARRFVATVHWATTFCARPEGPLGDCEDRDV